MDFFNAVESRRSVKHFDSTYQLSSTDFNRLIQTTMLSPTSYNIQHWRFLRVREESLREQLKVAAWGQEQLVDASELLILCADLNAWRDRPDRYWANAPKDTQETLVSMLSDFYRDKPQLQRDEAIRSCGIAAQTLMLSAKAMGFDSGALVGYDPEQVAGIIKLPDHYVIGMMVVIGKALQAAKPRGGQLGIDEVLFENQF